jgi:hypothetical protein
MGGTAFAAILTGQRRNLARFDAFHVLYYSDGEEF